jgi:hypothetical protein
LQRYLNDSVEAVNASKKLESEAAIANDKKLLDKSVVVEEEKLNLPANNPSTRANHPPSQPMIAAQQSIGSTTTTTPTTVPMPFNSSSSIYR